MTEQPAVKSTTLSFEHIKESDARVVNLSAIGLRLYDQFEEQLQAIGMTPTTGRDMFAKKMWTMYIGTLFAENYLASIHLTMLALPRAQVNINRQLFEYFIRNQWFLHHPDVAADLLDSLPKLVYGEVSRTNGVFEQSVIDVIDQQYDKWFQSSPLANANVQPADIKKMTDELSHGNSSREYYYNYSLPSILCHARPHGITDVLRKIGPNQFERQPNSIWFDRVDVLSHAIGIVFQYAFLLAGHFKLDTSHFVGLNQEFANALMGIGLQPESVGVKFQPSSSGLLKQQ